MARNWKIAKNRSDAPEGFPLAILRGNLVIAWVKEEADAKFIVKAESELSESESGLNRYRSLYFSAEARRHGSSI